MAELLIQGAHVVDPSRQLNGVMDIRIRNGVFAEIAPGLAPLAGEEVFDAKGLTAVPGLVDVHVHFREPGDEEEETIASGCASAAAGGFTSVACMPNTEPAMDSESSMSFVYLQAQKSGLCRVYPVGAITKGRGGQELAEMGSMVRGGAVAFSDDGTAIPTAGLARRAFEYAKMLDRPIMEHCEDKSLAGKGVMHEGIVSTRLGLAGIPSEAEEVIVSRDIMLSRLTGARLHLQHISTIGSVELLRRAKAEGLPVTAEVTPHHLTLTHEDVRGYDPSFKMNPPLRTMADIRALVDGLRDGTIDMIASDHAPHAQEEKEVEFSYAAFGAIGLESTVGVILTRLIHGRELTMEQLVPAMTTAPAKLLGIDAGSMRPGAPGDVALLDIHRKWVIDATAFRSRSRNCPFHGMPCTGRTMATVLGGRVVYRAPA